MAELDPTEAITTFKMETAATYGSIIEFVRGATADSFDRPQPCSSGMKEAMVFAFIAGLSDLHHENVLWRDGKPYFIDADNALNHDRLGLTMKPQARNQGGFSKYSKDAATEQLNTIDKTPEDAESKIMQALLANSEQQPIIEAVRTAFTGKTGRVVPIATGSWARALKQIYILKPEGTLGDNDYSTRWGIAAKQAARVPTGTPDTPEPGLQGEAGIPKLEWLSIRLRKSKKLKQISIRARFRSTTTSTTQVMSSTMVMWYGMGNPR